MESDWTRTCGVGPNPGAQARGKIQSTDVRVVTLTYPNSRTSASGFPSAPSRIRPDNVATCVGGVGVGVGSGEGVVAGTGPGVVVGAVVSNAVGVGAVAVPPLPALRVDSGGHSRLD